MVWIVHLCVNSPLGWFRWEQVGLRAAKYPSSDEYRQRQNTRCGSGVRRGVLGNHRGGWYTGRGHCLPPFHHHKVALLGMWAWSIPIPSAPTPLSLFPPSHPVLPHPIRRRARRPWDAATRVPTDGQPSSELPPRTTAPLAGESWRFFLLTGPGIQGLRRFGFSWPLKRTELLSAQPCLSSLLAVRSCPSTTHRSSSSSPAEATCRFLIRLSLISVFRFGMLFCNFHQFHNKLDFSNENNDWLLQVLHIKVDNVYLHNLKPV